jgi:predicted permease
MTLGAEPDLYTPLAHKLALTPGETELESWTDYYLYLVGRRAPGLSMAQSAAALNGVYAGLKEQNVKAKFFGDDTDRARYLKSKLSLEPGGQGYSTMRKRMQTPLRILLVCTALVVLIAAANAANLLLARAARRGKEISIRVAMGAGRWQIVRQLLGEAMLLAAGGGVAGVVSGIWILDLLIRLSANDGDGGHSLVAQLDPIVLVYTAGIALLSGLVFGLYPAWAASRVSLATTLKEESSQSSATLGGVRMRRALVVAQVSFSLLLLIPTGLFLKSLVNLTHVDLGVRGENLLTFGISPSLNGYSAERAEALYERTENELAAIPGVEHVASARVPLVAGNTWASSIEVEGLKHDRKFETQACFNSVGPGFFRKMGVGLIAGRDISDRDTAATPLVAVVNESWAKHFSADRPVLGRRFAAHGGTDYDTTVVGVVKDMHVAQVREERAPQFFMAYRQAPKATHSQAFYVRSQLSEAQLSAAVRRVMSGLDADLPLEDFRSFDEQVRRSVHGERVLLTLAGAFAGLATVLAMLGLYGVLAFQVARRTREIGIRMALGAAEATIGRMVMSEVGVVLGVGALIGVPAALGLAHFAESELYGVKAFDSLVVFAAVVALALAAVLAGLIPARRATRVSPLEALRYE